MVACVSASMARAITLLGGAGVAVKPQAAAIRAEPRVRELIAAGSAHSVSRRAISVPVGVGSAAGAPRGWGCVRISGVCRPRAPRHRSCVALQLITARCRLRRRLRGRDCARRSWQAFASARLPFFFRIRQTPSMAPGSARAPSGPWARTGARAPCPTAPRHLPTTTPHRSRSPAPRRSTPSTSARPAQPIRTPLRTGQPSLSTIRPDPISSRTSQSTQVQRWRSATLSMLDRSQAAAWSQSDLPAPPPC